MVFSGMKNADFCLSGVSFLYAFMLESICAVFVGICLHLFCFGVIKLIKMGNISPIQRKIFGMHVRYVKIKTAMTPEWLTTKQSGSQKCFTKERNSLKMNMSRGLPWT